MCPFTIISRASSFAHRCVAGAVTAASCILGTRDEVFFTEAFKELLALRGAVSPDYFETALRILRAHGILMTYKKKTPAFFRRDPAATLLENLYDYVVRRIDKQVDRHRRAIVAQVRVFFAPSSFP